MCDAVLTMPFCATKSRIDRLRDPIPSVSCKAPRACTEYLVVLCDLPATSIDAFLMGVARTQEKVCPSPVSVPAANSEPFFFHFLYSPRGNPNLNAAARLVLRDWSTSKLRGMPSCLWLGRGPAADAVSPAQLTICAGDAVLLERLLSSPPAPRPFVKLVRVRRRSFARAHAQCVVFRDKDDECFSFTSDMISWPCHRGIVGSLYVYLPFPLRDVVRARV
jgi:hypothetical protein